MKVLKKLTRSFRKKAQPEQPADGEIEDADPGRFVFHDGRIAIKYEWSGVSVYTPEQLKAHIEEGLGHDFDMSLEQKALKAFEAYEEDQRREREDDINRHANRIKRAASSRRP